VSKAIRGGDGFMRDFGCGRYENLSGAISWLAFFAGGAADVRRSRSVCEALEAKGLGARQRDLLFHRIDNRIEAIRIGTARPVRDVKRLTRLLCDKIETVDRGSASRSCAWPRRSPCRWRRNR
jgi:hypothetical protein